MPGPPERYLFVLPWSPVHPGGVNQVVLNLAREMQQAGRYDPILLIQDWTAARPQWGEFQGLRTVRWRIRPIPPKMRGWRHLVHRLWDLGFRRAFLRFCEAHRVAAVNLHYPGVTAFTFDRALSMVRPDLPLILSLHGTDLKQIAAAQSKEREAWQELLMRRTVIACSFDLARRVSTLFGTRVTAVTIHNGIDAARFASALQSDAVPEQPYILSVGKFETTKGQRTLIDAFAQIADRYPDLQLVLVGASGASLSEFSSAARLHALEDRVRFFVDVPHQRMPAFFRCARVFALPSTEEAFGIVILEAGLSALPVVASCVGGIPEIISDEETGLLVAPGDPSALADALRRILDHPEDATAMAGRLRARVLTGFTWRSAHDKYVEAVAKAREMTPIAHSDSRSPA